MSKLCPFCHAWMSDNVFDQHIASHTRLLPDGQQKDHVTVRPEERYAGDIAKEPKWYVHPRCGGVTGMPEEIIRSYIADPFLYNESSFCTGCGNYVPTSELYWQETNESLQAASYRRKAEFIQKNHLNPNEFVWDAHGPARRKSRGGGSGWVIGLVAAGSIAVLFLLGFVFLVGVVSHRGNVRNRRGGPAMPVGARMPDFDREFPRMEPARVEIPDFEIPKGPDLNEIMQKQREHMEKIQKQHEEMMEKMRPSPLNPGEIGGFPDFGPPVGPGGIGPPALAPAGSADFDPYGGIEAARKRSEEIRKRAEERMEAARKRIRP